jgi:hypothetical protein
MKKTICVLLFILSLDCYAQTATEILDKYFEAVGGRNNWDNVQDMYIEKTTLAFDSKAVKELALKAKAITSPSALLDMSVSRSVDTMYLNPTKKIRKNLISSTNMESKKTRYYHNYYQEKKRTMVVISSGKNLKMNFEDAGDKTYTEYTDTQSIIKKYKQFEYKGEEVFQTKNCYKLSIKEPDNKIWYYFFEKTTFELVGTQLANDEHKTTTLYEGYLESNGLKIPIYHKTYVHGTLLFDSTNLVFKANRNWPTETYLYKAL